MSYGLGRIPSPRDSRDFKLAIYVAEPTVTERFWAVGPTLNQGSTPHCVGFAGADWGNCLPVDDEWDDSQGHALYYAVKVLEGEPGEENGAWVRDLAKVLKNEGRIGTYAFGNLATARAFVLTQGPVVLGIRWYEDMDRPDSEGRVRPTGDLRGGHAVLLYGADPDYAYLQNSWGDGWGDHGCCRIGWRDLALCMDGNGEAMAAVELPVDTPRPPRPGFWARLWARLCYLWRSFFV